MTMAGPVWAVVVASTVVETGFADLKGHLVGYLPKNSAAYSVVGSTLDPGRAAVGAAFVLVVAVGSSVAAAAVVVG